MVVEDKETRKTWVETLIIMLKSLTKTITKSNKLNIKPKILLNML